MLGATNVHDHRGSSSRCVVSAMTEAAKQILAEVRRDAKLVTVIHRNVVTKEPAERRRPTHPGLLLEELLGHTSPEKAARLRQTVPDLDSIIAGESRISQGVAERLEATFGGDASLWTNMQVRYDNHGS